MLARLIVPVGVFVVLLCNAGHAVVYADQGSTSPVKPPVALEKRLDELARQLDRLEDDAVWERRRLIRQIDGNRGG